MDRRSHRRGATGGRPLSSKPSLIAQAEKALRDYPPAPYRNPLAKQFRAPPVEHPLVACTMHQLINVDLPELEPLLEPWLFEKNLAMIHAKRGVGKTFLTLAVAYAVASGTSFLGWSAPKPRGVIYIDGEMPAQLMQSRLRELASAHGEIPDLLRIITPDLQDAPMPDLATYSGQAAIDELVTSDTRLIVVDNLSCLVRSGGAENESESWRTVSEWALAHRRAGRAVLFVHHSGKSGAQRGTSKREDLLDVVIGLRRPPEYVESEGAVFEIVFEKSRSVTGEAIDAIEAKLNTLPSGSQNWTWRAVDGLNQERMRKLWDGGGLTIIDIAREVDVHKSTVARCLKSAMDAGQLQRPYPSRRTAAEQVARNT